LEQGTLPVGGGSGTGHFNYVVSPLTALQERAGSAVKSNLNNNLTATDIEELLPADACLVFGKTFATEGSDRTSFHLDWNGDALVENVASVCENTIVVTHSAGINTMPWADHPNVTAILAAHLPGQESGHSLTDVLFGDVNPSAKLPYTVALHDSDYNGAVANVTAGDTNPQAEFTEGLFIDYRHFDAANLPVQFEFGFGLSYTSFTLSSLRVSPVSGVPSAVAPRTANAPGGNPALWEALYRVTAVVKNTGRVSGAAVPQLYVGLPEPGTPARQLRGFDKVVLAPGQSAQVEFDVLRRDISVWDVTIADWRIPSGEVGFEVGFSSRDIKARQGVQIGRK
jgi:beta-glucosidase